MNKGTTDEEIITEIVNKPKKLSPDQEKAVLAQEKHIKVIAGAGAGKTETLTRRIAYLLLVKKIQPSEIVAFTFTEKAAQSMKDRIYRRVADILGPDSTSILGEMYVGTIHGYAKRILDDHFRYGNYGVMDENQEVAFLMRNGWAIGVNNYGGYYSKGCLNFLRTVNMVWDEMLDKEDVKKQAPDFHRRMLRYEKLLTDHKLLTFGWMMYLAAKKIQEKPEVLGHIKYLIVDEYQDINKSQSILIEAIGKHADLFVVGDPRQSIYQWRGSDESFFRRFSEMFPESIEIPIRENRRSTKLIVDNANKFADSFETTKYDSMDPIHKEEGFFGLAEQNTPNDEAKWIADQVEHLIKNCNVSYSDIGILMRSVGSSATPLLNVFRRRGIRFIVGGKVGLFRRDETQAIGRIFAWLSEDGFWVEDFYRWSAQTQGDELLDSAIARWNSALGERAPGGLIDELLEIRDAVYDSKSPFSNFTQLYEKILNVLGFQELNYQDRNDAAIMANLGRFSELLSDYESAHRFGGQTLNWTRDLKGLCWFLNSYATQAYEERIQDDLRGVDAVQVMTVHQAKGLEWPVVFVASMVDRRFPSSKIGERKNWCGVPRDMFDVQRYEGTTEDERRLFYVAITRAKDALVVSYFRRMRNRRQRSPFIEDMDLGLAALFGGKSNIPTIDIKTITEDLEMQTFTASEIIAYRGCPHNYLLGSIWGYQPGFNPGIGYGNSLHYCLKRASELVKNDGFNPLSAVVTAVDDDFFVPYVGGQVFDNYKKGARNTLLTFSQKYQEDFGRIEEVEYRLEFPVEGATITGRVDVILRGEEDLEVREYKTSGEAKTFEECSIQTRLYGLGLTSMGRPVKTGSVAYLEEADVKPVTMQQEDVNAAKQKVEEAVKSIINRDYSPRPGDMCKACDRGPICRWRCMDG
jgi:DNA helicase-2/ATP-dependent DNA helicase PcrA